MKRVRFVFICVAFLFLSVAYCFCAHSQVSYNPKNERDPFVPLVTDERVSALGLEYVETIDDLRLEGIIFDPSAGSMAILNGEVVREGDSLYNLKILNISGSSVVLTVYDIEYTVSLAEEGGGE